MINIFSRKFNGIISTYVEEQIKIIYVLIDKHDVVIWSSLGFSFRSSQTVLLLQTWSAGRIINPVFTNN